jgi:hypothetical protein
MIVIVYCPFFGLLLNVQQYRKKCVIFEDAFLFIFLFFLRRSTPGGCLDRHSPGSALDAVHHKGVRLALGTFLICITENLLCEAGFTKMNIIRKLNNEQHKIGDSNTHKHRPSDQIFYESK